MIEIFILSLIQGIAEFLPISSSSHLILISKYLEFDNQSLSIDVSLHIGSFLAVIIYFTNDIKNFFKNKLIFYKILLSSLPVMVVGFFLVEFDVINKFRNIETIAWMTFIFGILLYISDKFKVEKKIDSDLNITSILLIGLFQMLSLIPGVSRSGIVITAGRFLNFDRFESTKISFYLSIPAIAGASFLTLKDLGSSIFDNNIIILLGICFSFIFSYLTIKYFLIYIKNFTLFAFVIYRVILSFILFISSILD